MDLALYLRLANCLFAGLVAGLCYLKLENSHPDKARNYRIAGLGMLCLAISLGSFATRHDAFNYRLPMITVGLGLSFYGMRRMAIGEKPQIKN